MPLFTNKNKLKSSLPTDSFNYTNSATIATATTTTTTTNGCGTISSSTISAKSAATSTNSGSNYHTFSSIIDNSSSSNNNNNKTTVMSVKKDMASTKSFNDRNYSMFPNLNQMTMNNSNTTAASVMPVNNGNSGISGNNIFSSSSSSSEKGTVATSTSATSPAPSSPSVPASKQPLIFHCQLAHGSPTGLITGFSSVKELYQKIAECYEFPTEEIIFCTLNTHKIDMTKLLGGQIGLDDFIFAHRKGRPKEIEIVKTEDALGLTITDNGAGYAFIKRIKEGSVIHKIPHIMVGDHIEKLNDVNVVGKRHFEVARLLKDIPTGSTFTLRLIEPIKSGFQGIGPRSSGSAGKGNKKVSYGSGRETLRFKANGNAEIEDIFDDKTEAGIDAINALLDSFMGINDSELATQIWDLGADKTNSMDFAEALDNSDLEAFGFTDDFIIELWGAITDARHGRLKK